MNAASEERAENGAARTTNDEEANYLNLAKKVVHCGVERMDRTGVGTMSVFGATLRFSLEGDSFPLLTTKKIFWRGVVEELLWMISGSTNSFVLSRKGVHIWDSNGSKAFLEKCNLGHREEGDLGPVYGFQWRHCGAKYVDMHEDYSGRGIDQLADCIDKIKNNPSSRRIVMSAWNPVDIGDMVLPPCHMFCQFYVSDGFLSCLMYQRSADICLGVPFNIASYALLTRMVAHVCGLKPKEFVHVLGDAHVYLNHVEGFETQWKRDMHPFPTLAIRDGVEGIDAFSFSDFTLRDYVHEGTIKYPLAV